MVGKTWGWGVLLGEWKLVRASAFLGSLARMASALKIKCPTLLNWKLRCCLQTCAIFSRNSSRRNVSRTCYTYEPFLSEPKLLGVGESLLIKQNISHRYIARSLSNKKIVTRLFCCDTIYKALLDFIAVSPVYVAVKWNVCLADDILFLNREKTKQSLQVGSDNYSTGG